MRVSLGSDHGGYLLKESVKKHLKENNIDYVDCGTNSTESVDYPDYAQAACEKVQSGECDLALLFCGTGVGISIAANKMNGILACNCSDTFSAKYSRLHNNANALCLGGRVVGPGLANDIVDLFLTTDFEGGRHERRVEKIKQIEKSQRRKY
jgi:ribose 5-phosphate isomerase B